MKSKEEETPERKINIQTLSLLGVVSIILGWYRESLNELVLTFSYHINQNATLVSLSGVCLILLSITILLGKAKTAAWREKYFKWLNIKLPFFSLTFLIIGAILLLLPIASSQLNFGRLDKVYTVALITSSNRADVRDKLATMIEEVEHKVGKTILYTTMNTARTDKQFRDNLKDAKRGAYDLVVVDDLRFADLLREDEGVEYLSRFTMYVSFSPTYRRDQDEYSVVSLHPEAVDLVRRSYYLSSHSSDKSVVFVVSDGAYGSRTRAAVETLNSNWNKSSASFIENEAIFGCSVDPLNCDSIFTLIDPFFDPNGIAMKFGQEDIIVRSRHIAETRPKLPNGVKTYNIEYPWELVLKSLIKSHSDLDRPIKVSETLLRSSKDLWEEQFIRLNRNGEVIYSHLAVSEDL